MKNNEKKENKEKEKQSYISITFVLPRKPSRVTPSVSHRAHIFNLC